MTEEARGEAQPGSGEPQRQVQRQERQISDSPCLYISSEILVGLAASNADGKDQNAMRYSQMTVVPPSFEVWIAPLTRFQPLGDAS